MDAKRDTAVAVEVMRELVRRCLATTDKAVRDEIKQVLLQAARGEFDTQPSEPRPTGQEHRNAS